MDQQSCSLSARGYDHEGRLQMAEGRLGRHGDGGTAIEDLFLVHHYDQPVPSDDHHIEVVGPNGRSRSFSLEDLRSFEQREEVVLLECAGNGRGLRSRRTPGNQFGLGMFGQSRWTGVSLADVLEACGFTDGWTTAAIQAPDGGVTMPEGAEATFGKGLPRAKALEPDTLIAWAVDGRPLPVEHGGPIRLVVPGWYGIWWVKWVSRIQLSHDEFRGFWQNERYTYQDETGRVLGVVAEQSPRAIITSPTEGDRLHDDAVLNGLAWAGEHEVRDVETSVDDGLTWTPARITARTGGWGWLRWEAQLPAGLQRGMCRVAVRATDAIGRSQPWDSAPDRLGYGNNGVHRITVDLLAGSSPKT